MVSAREYLRRESVRFQWRISHVNNRCQRQLSLTFTADQIAVRSYLAENSTGGTLYQDLDIEIDGLPVGVFDFAGHALPRERSCGAAKVFRFLGPGSHTITVKPTASGSYAVVDSFIVPITAGFAPVIMDEPRYFE
ncbi:hypothetical protein B5K08_05950 [Rhizobium leguminosarum bv. trifolii]|uniref:Uncharacterized protein n=1 Tax=Rhizobium leguminosarum bv. trifolii TaxID=386 RepID=A0A3E1BY90_RHILT|nr:hypothetical protein [Rhizobium leguminosarum]RFB97850.1 hypothetical protein B5K08_05950 [Rhizobium leguminosarum bv. trifolii]RFC00036.1 hypothetical protein B5K10_05940 [Rhizobium leguminosarum bv. trifolii]